MIDPTEQAERNKDEAAVAAATHKDDFVFELFSDSMQDVDMRFCIRARNRLPVIIRQRDEAEHSAGIWESAFYELRRQNKASIEELAARAEAAEAKLARLKSLLRDLEWSGAASDGSAVEHAACPTCGGLNDRSNAPAWLVDRWGVGHKPNCEIAAALAAKGKQPC